MEVVNGWSDVAAYWVAAADSETSRLAGERDSARSAWRQARREAALALKAGAAESLKIRAAEQAASAATARAVRAEREAVTLREQLDAARRTPNGAIASALGGLDRSLPCVVVLGAGVGPERAALGAWSFGSQLPGKFGASPLSVSDSGVVHGGAYQWVNSSMCGPFRVAVTATLPGTLCPATVAVLEAAGRLPAAAIAAAYAQLAGEHEAARVLAKSLHSAAVRRAAVAADDADRAGVAVVAAKAAADRAAAVVAAVDTLGQSVGAAVVRSADPAAVVAAVAKVAAE